MQRSYDRRALLRMLGLGTGAVALSACAPSGGGGSTPSGDPEAKDFTFASWSLADDASKIGPQHLVDAYQKANGGTITGLPIAFPDYLNQLLLQIRGGQFTGVAQLDIAWLSAVSALGKLRDLGPLAQGVDYTDTALSTGQLDGKQYGLPWTTAAIGMIVNQDILAKVGADALPETVSDFEALLVEIAATGVLPYAASTKVAQLKDMLIWMQTFGCSLIDGDKITIGDDASVDALTWYKSLYDRKLIAADVERTDARTLFSQGRTAMYDDALVGKDVVAKQSPDKELINKIAPHPRPVVAAGDTPQAQQWGHILVVVEGEGAASAAKFAKWATSDPTAAAGYFKDVSLPPTTDTGLAAPEVAGDQFTTQFNERVTATATPNPFWRFPQYAQMENAVSEHVQAALIGKSSPADAMRDAKKAVEGLV
ncbi:ABC transporter substrate-binding protein [Actinophytocola xinjiangensis]|uniref:ABC transporter substrate-binding protein n=1 Tax=Actinophytocola xinjiangensis TaxID=485602 RepID=A0A7Z0WHG1_9PSEU|nr:extracellular solute-binding protein [Actinophytocola xinjiangensis]OLF06806.1 ABC transporter substrate-binding protein [Actinophytocola xinjiangensis]